MMGTKWRTPGPVYYDSGFWNGVCRDVFLYALAISVVVGLAVWIS
jgi:hypothetical protein